MRTVSGRFHYTWPKMEWNTCSPQWDLVLVAEVGKVTSTTVEVRAVTAKFYPTAGNQIVPSTLDVWIPGGDITDLQCERTPSLQILPSTLLH